MIDIKISANKGAELMGKGYDLWVIAFLQLIKNGEDIPDCAGYSKTEAKCVRKGLILGNKLTKVGEELLEFLDRPEVEKFEKKKSKDEEFLLFWSEFPSTDQFIYKNKTFPGSRGLRVKREDCKIKLNSILSQGEYKIEDIIRALKYDIYLKKENSYKTGQNKLSYLQNSLTYLNQLSFEPFLELSKDKEIKEEKIISNDTFL